MNRQLLTLSLISILVLPSWSEEVFLESIRDLRWENRIILVSADEESDEWIDRLRASEPEIVDRDIIWIAVQRESYTSNLTTTISEKLTQEIEGLFSENENTKVLLIGKDGGIKDVSNHLNLPELFAQIDGMPMRQAEIRTRSE